MIVFLFSLLCCGCVGDERLNGVPVIGTDEQARDLDPDQDSDGIIDAEEDRLLATYAPILVLHGGCPVQGLDRPREAERPVSMLDFLQTCAVIGPQGTFGDLIPHEALRDDPGLLLQLPNDGSGTALAPRVPVRSNASVAYGHCVRGKHDIVYLQWYYFFASSTTYAPLQIGSHSGDLVCFEMSLRDTTPVSATYWAHGRSIELKWCDVEREGNRATAYVEAGSHELHPRWGLYRIENASGVPHFAVCDGAGPAVRGYRVVNLGEPSQPRAGNGTASSIEIRIILEYRGAWGGGGILNSSPCGAVFNAGIRWRQQPDVGP